MINQATTFQRVRIPVVAIAAFALGALASAAVPQFHLGSAASAPLITQAPATLGRPVLTTTRSESSTNCGPGAYVSGDMVGDASPAAVHTTMCGR